MASKKTAAQERLAVKAVAEHALHRAPLHYSEGSDRQDAINRPFDWTHADCSSFYTSCYKGAKLPDPSGRNFAVGDYTGTLGTHGHIDAITKNGKRVWTPRIGDAVLYRPPFPYGHVAVYVGNGMVISHGSEGGPFLEPVHYRSDFAEFRRYIHPSHPLKRYWELVVDGHLVWHGKRGAKLAPWVKLAARHIKDAKVKRS